MVDVYVSEVVVVGIVECVVLVVVVVGCEVGVLVFV